MGITPSVIAGIGALGSAGASIYGAANGKSSTGPGPGPQFHMPMMNQAATNAWENIRALPATNYSQYLPMYEAATNNLYSNPYAAGGQQGVGQASQMGQQQAMGQYGIGQDLTRTGQSLLPFAQRIEETAFDPRSALYNRTQQQLQEQTRAAQAARGIAMSPYGAGVENKAMSDFNIDWQNQQLQRQVQGAAAAGGLVDQGGRTIGAGQQMAMMAPQQFAQASMMPYQTAQGMGQNQQQALNALFGGGAAAQGLASLPFNQLMQYMGMGNQAGGVANQNAQVGLNQAQAGFNQNQTLGSNLGAGLQGLGNQNNWNWLNSMKSSYFPDPTMTGGGYGMGGVY